MKIIKTITLLLATFIIIPVFASATTTPPADKTPVIDLRKIKASQIEKLTGKKLNVFDKLRLKILQKKLGKYEDTVITEKQKKQATWSMILGILSIGLLFVPFIGILAIPSAVLALVFGIQSVKGNGNSKGIVGIVTGSITLALFFIALVFVAAILAGG